MKNAGLSLLPWLLSLLLGHRTALLCLDSALDGAPARSRLPSRFGHMVELRETIGHSLIGQCEIAGLASALGSRHDDTRRRMRQAYRGVGLVPVLSSRPTCTEEAHLAEALQTFPIRGVLVGHVSLSQIAPAIVP